MNTHRRDFIKTAGAGLASLALSPSLFASELSNKKPNIIIVFCDDLGYGDLGAFGHPTIHTPNLDRLAVEGQRWTNFYAAASVCTPSRAAIMTGRYPIRSGMCSDKRRVLFPDSAGGLPAEEITIAELLKKQGYATACVGKWHLGHLNPYLPTNNGFDYYIGIPYSNDMDATEESRELGRDRFWHPKPEYFNVPLMRNEEIIERPANQNTITRRYTEKSIKFIKENSDQPFFIYLAHSLPHVPLFASEKFRDTSLRGLYGDVIEEIDWGVGQIVKTLRELNLCDNTLIVFTSDNGPWLTFDQHGGSAGLLREGKGSTWEGGMREPTIFWWPGRVEPGVVMDMGSTMDLLPTACKLAGADIPSDRVIDGYDLRSVLFNREKSPRDHLVYYRGQQIYAIRKEAFKAHYITQTAYKGEKPVRHDPPVLHNLLHDPSEKYNIADKHPDVIEEINALREKHKASIKPVEDQLAKRINNS